MLFPSDQSHFSSPPAHLPTQMSTSCVLATRFVKQLEYSNLCIYSSEGSVPFVHKFQHVSIEQRFACGRAEGSALVQHLALSDADLFERLPLHSLPLNG